MSPDKHFISSVLRRKSYLKSYLAATAVLDGSRGGDDADAPRG